MFCKNCGSNLKDGSTFCHNCGSPVNDYIVNNAVVSAPESVPLAPQAPIQNVPITPVPQQPIQTPYVVSSAPPVQQPTYTQTQIPQQYGYAPYPSVPEPKKSGGAFPILALIFGIIGISADWIGILFAPVALVFGIISRKKSKSGMSIAGIILGSIGIVTSIIALISMIYFAIYGENPLNSFTFFDDGLYF